MRYTMKGVEYTLPEHINPADTQEVNRIRWLANNSKNVELRAAAGTLLQVCSLSSVVPSKKPGPAPRTYKEARKLAWMAGQNYGNARATMLAARDQDHILCVLDEEYEGDDESQYRLLLIDHEGRMIDENFYDKTYQETEIILARYPQINPTPYLLEVQAREEIETDHEDRMVRFYTIDQKHALELCVWAIDQIEIHVDGRDSGFYVYRDPIEVERQDSVWSKAAAVLQPEASVEQEGIHMSSDNIGLLPERRDIVWQKIQEVLAKDGRTNT